MDPREDCYLAEFLPTISPPSLAASSAVHKTLCELFPTISPAFLQARAQDIGSDQAKLNAFIAQIYSTDQSSLPSKLEYNKERREQTELEQALAMKPSDFLLEFAPSPHRHFSDLGRRVSPLYTTHAYHCLVGRFASQVQGGVSKVEEVLQSKRYLLFPCWKELKQLPKSRKQMASVESPRNKLTKPKPNRMEPDFLKELIFINLEDRIRWLSMQRSDRRKIAVEAARTTGGLFKCGVCSSEENLLSEAVLCSGGCQVCPSCVLHHPRLKVGDCSCGGEFSLESLRRLLPASTYQVLVKERAAQEKRKAGLKEVKCPACQADVFPGSAEETILECEECGVRSCLACSTVDHSPLPCKVLTTKVNVKPSRALTEDPLQTKFRLFQSHFFQQLGQGQRHYSVSSMDIVQNSRMKEDFERKKAEFKEKGIPAEAIYAYHGTKSNAIDSILQDNFDLSKAVRQAHGRGNYFSEFPETALGYSDDKKQLILCEILPGLSYSGHEMAWPGYNSKLVQPTGPEGYSQMVIIEDHHQILPVAVIHL